MLTVAYIIQHIVTLAAYSIHTVKWAAANFTVCYILLPGVSAHPAEKKKRRRNCDYTSASPPPAYDTESNVTPCQKGQCPMKNLKVLPCDICPRTRVYKGPPIVHLVPRLSRSKLWICLHNFNVHIPESLGTRLPSTVHLVQSTLKVTMWSLNYNSRALPPPPHLSLPPCILLSSWCYRHHMMTRFPQPSPQPSPRQPDQPTSSPPPSPPSNGETSLVSFPSHGNEANCACGPSSLSL